MAGIAFNAFNVQEYELVIFNRWGQRIFQTKNPSAGWDGKFNGKLQNGSVFVWYSGFKRNNKQLKLKGTMVLIR